MPDLGERGPKQPAQRHELRTKVIDRWQLSDGKSLLSQGKLPGKELVAFLKEHGLDACSRCLKPRALKSQKS